MSNALASERARSVIEHPAAVLRPLLVGALSGMGTFVYTRPLLAPWGEPLIGLAFVVAAGIYAHLLSETMRESVRVALGGAVVGIAVTVLAFAAPLWIFAIGPARGLLLVGYLQQSMATVVVVYPLVYLGAYFVAVSADGLTT